jgi:hypothetical protein
MVCLLLVAGLSAQARYIAENGRMHFKSDAPLELIEATSTKLKGILDTGNGSFAFSVDIPTFQGFNSPLQREHFNENYLESRRYPRATFVGKIIEEVDFFAPGTYEVRSKGILEVHGVKQERIIKGVVSVAKDGISIRSDFTVLLEDHKISIPRIVHQKIAEEILVDMSIFLLPNSEK